MGSALVLGAYLLDSSVLILSLRGDTAIRARLATTNQLFIPSTALGELYFGAYSSPTRSSAALADIASLWLASYATLITRVGDFFRRPQIRRAMERVTGVVLVGLGLRLATEQR